MTVIVKIMEDGNLRQTSDNQASHRVITSVEEVTFSRDLRGQAFITLMIARPPRDQGDTVDGDFARTHQHFEINSPVFVLSEQGKSVSSFDGRPTGVKVNFNNDWPTLAQGPMRAAFLRQVFSLAPDAELFRLTSRSDSYYGRSRPFNHDVPRGENLWEPVPKEDIVFISENDTFFTALPVDGRLADPPPRLPSPEEKASAATKAIPDPAPAVRRAADGLLSGDVKLTQESHDTLEAVLAAIAKGTAAQTPAERATVTAFVLGMSAPR